MGAIVQYVPPTEPLRAESAALILGDEGQKSLLALAGTVERFVTEAQALEVKTDADAQAANNILAHAKVALDKLEADRTQRKAPILAEGRALDALYKPAQDAFSAIRDAIRRKLAAHIQAKQEAAAEAMRRSQEAAEKAAAALEEAARKEAEAKSDEARRRAQEDAQAATQALVAARQDRPLEDVPTSVRSSFGHSSMTFKPAVRVTDLALVPRRFLEQAVREEAARAKKLERVALLDAALLAEFKASQAPIEGVEFYEEPVLRTRVGLQ